METESSQDGAAAGEPAKPLADDVDDKKKSLYFNNNNNSGSNDNTNNGAVRLPSVETVSRLRIVENYHPRNDEHDDCDGDNDKRVDGHESLGRKKIDMDPYRELELYLEKVNEEIGEIIESVPSTPFRVKKEEEEEEEEEEETEFANVPSKLKFRRNEDPRDDKVELKKFGANNNHGSRSLANKINLIKRQNSVGFNAKNDDDWSDNILAEFNNLIAKEINDLCNENLRKNLTRNKLRNDNGADGYDDDKIIDYKELLNEFGICDSDCDDDFERLNDSKSNDDNEGSGKIYSEPKNEKFLNSDYDEPRDQIDTVIKFNESFKYGAINCGDVSSDYDEPNDVVSSNDYSINERSSQFSDICDNSGNCFNKIPKNCFNNVDIVDDKLPPKYNPSNNNYIRKTSMPINLSSLQKRRKNKIFKIQERSNCQEPDYDDVNNFSKSNEMISSSKSFDNNSTRSAPVTPTEDKKITFSKLLRKKHSPVMDKNLEAVVLVRVSSLPDEDLISGNKSNDKSKSTDGKNFRTKQKRSVSPFTLRSDISAKRLSESDKDIRQISPVELKTFSQSLSRCRSNDVAVDCHIRDNSRYKNEGMIEISNDEGIRTIEEHNARSGSLPISLHSLLSRIKNGSSSCCSNVSQTNQENITCADTGTQTSPVLSRSSSCNTWVSDCDSPHGSPQDTVDDDNRSSSSSQDILQSMDEISSGSLSPEVNDRDRSSPLESGIGTASPPPPPPPPPPPRSSERRLTKPAPSHNKCHRKETWERLRRRPSKINSSRSEKYSVDVWVRRESVHTQTRDRDDDCCYQMEMIDSSSGLDDSLPRVKFSRPTNFPSGLSNAASSSMSSGELLETPPRAPSSPSAASLQLNNEPMNVELCGKSNSAPLLENVDEGKGGNDERIVIVMQQPRSQSERHLSEIEAQEACKWLRAAGFPQYAQMYEDYQFPIEVSGVAKDHPFLDADSLQSLFRRLQALNRCANMKLDTNHSHHHHHHHTTGHSKPGGDDSDEDNQCALSENWTFEKKTRRWSRVGDVSQAAVEKLQAIADENSRPEDEDDSMEDRLEAGEADDTMLDTLKYGSLPPGPLADDVNPRFRRTGSERFKDSAKAWLRRVESLKSRRRKRQNREGVVISGPQVLDVISMQQKMKDLNCVDVSPTGPAPVSFNDLLPASPLHLPPSPLTLPSSPFHLPASPLATNHQSPFGDDSSSYCSDGSQGGGPVNPPTKTKLNRPRRFLHRGGREDQGALSDSECQPTSWRHRYFKDANSNNTKVPDYINNCTPQSQIDKDELNASKPIPITSRGGSLNLGKESQRYRDKFNQSQENRYKDDKICPNKRDERLNKSFRRGRDDICRDDIPLNKDVTIYREKSRSRSSELAGSQESSSTVASRDSDQEEESPRHKGNVVRWHSFQRGSLYPENSDPLCPRAMASMSCGQLLVLRKLALLKLTACMEKYCPTHRTGWNWELPKFIRKIKTPDYKDKTVFGVPLLLSLQRTGQALPKCIQIALRWLRANALDQTGIFRKSGLRSRIQTLKVMTETQGDSINFDGQQAFDVADLVKQYFRELPESLLTNKLSETFIAIFQHVPAEIRPEAVQCVLLLLPDEHREALETLLDFLNHVANNSPYNQMTASNLAVCLAPSLFHFNHTTSSISNRSNSVSPRRRKTVGIPDQRELSENKAANDCLLYLIKTHRELFMVSSDMLPQCRFNYMEESVPVGLEELGSELKQDWRGYLYACMTALLKEAREKSRGWVSVNNPADSGVEVAYKKVGDGHPLRLWRTSTEVEAPPNELLHRVLRERHIWDPQLLKYRLVNKLDSNFEVFQYATGNMSPLPARDYCVLRSWRSDLPKGACVIVETSVEHPDAPVMLGGTRGIVLASRYLIEPCGMGKSRIMHLSRVDTKGRTPDWYNKSYGHITALHLSKIRSSFKHSADGPESKV